jgi:hypothetical protein
MINERLRQKRDHKAHDAVSELTDDIMRVEDICYYLKRSAIFTHVVQNQLQKHHGRDQLSLRDAPRSAETQRLLINDHSA